MKNMWQAESRDLGRHAPVLFPIVGRLRMMNISIKVRPIIWVQHGFARDCDFEVENQYTRKYQFLLKDNEKTREMYPLNLNSELTII